jgi:putative addiction module killer protein
MLPIIRRGHAHCRVRNPIRRESFWSLVRQLKAPAAAKVTTALIRIGQGNTSNVESVGGGVYENKIDFGPGYRVYFGFDGKDLVVLVGGGSKKRQSKDRDRQGPLARLQATQTFPRRRLTWP